MLQRNFQRSLRTLSLNLLLLLSFSVFLQTQVSGNVVGFDFGSAYFKITLVKPGQPFSIVENTATKRKTETWLTITEDERIFGYDSLTESTKYPTQSYSQMHRFVGQEWNEDFITKMQKQRFIVNEMAKDDRGLIGWKIIKKDEEGNKEDQILYNEELIAQLFKYGRKLSEIQAKATIKDCVITIPSYYTPSQRRMILDAADIAGLSVLQLIHENTAAATMFGIDRLDTDKNLTVLFYNMGGMDTEVSLVRYSAITEASTNKSYEHIEVLAEAFDKELGGQDLDLVLVNMIADRFNALKERQGKPDIRENSRATKRLLKEATKIKDILSANKHNQIKIGELADYVSLQTIIERKEFEDASENFFARVIAPVQEVIQKAGISIDEIDQIELLGGGIRVPKVQEILQTSLKKSELGVHLNGDEAMCFGSAFIASNSSASFKVRKVYLTVHPQVQYSIHITPVDTSKLQSTTQSSQEEQIPDQESQPSTQSEEDSTQPPQQQQAIVYEKNYVLYKKTDFLGQKKSLSLTYDTDMKIDVYSEDTLNSDKKELVVTYTVKGINEVAEKVAKKENTTTPKVTLSFELSRSGLIQLNKAEAKAEETYFVEERQPTKKTSRVLNVTNSTENNSTNEANNETSQTSDSSSVDDSAPQTLKKQKKRTLPFPLNEIEKKYYGLPTLTNEQLKACRERLRWFEKRDEDKAKTDKAKNDFESVIYALRDWINEDENIPFVGGADKQEEILHLVRGGEDWLEGDGYSAQYGDYLKKFQELDKKFQQVKMRKEEHAVRDYAVEETLKKISQLDEKVQELQKKKPWITEEQKKDILERINETLAWLEENLEKQKEIPLDQDPAFRVSDLEGKLRRLDSTFQRLSTIPKPKSEKEGKKKKMPKNIKIENMKFDGNSDMNWEDFINVNGADDDEEEDYTNTNSNNSEEENTNQKQQQEDNTQFEQDQTTKKPYDASEEDL